MSEPEEKILAPKNEDLIALPGHLWFRRRLLTRLGWGGVAVCGGVSLAALIRFFYPRVLFEPPTEFKAGLPEEYRLGEVSTRWISSHRVWIVREKEGFYALYASCTHLGCTPGWLGSEQKFKCFCHGSGFYKTGINFEGPAPRPLERVRLSLADDGQLELDTSVRFRYEKIEWQKPGAFLKL